MLHRNVGVQQWSMKLCLIQHSCTINKLNTKEYITLAFFSCLGLCSLRTFFLEADLAPDFLPMVAMVNILSILIRKCINF